MLKNKNSIRSHALWDICKNVPDFSYIFTALSAGVRPLSDSFFCHLVAFKDATASIGSPSHNVGFFCLGTFQKTF